MFRNYIKIAFRNMLRHKGLSFINIFGLAIGIASCLLILQYVTFEFSYDDFHEGQENIYRVRLDQYTNNELIFKSSENYPGAGPALKKELPEVLEYARLYNLGSKNNVVIAYLDGPGDPIEFKHRRFLYADSSFLGMFSYPMIMGDPATALQEPFTMVISESYAKKYFGEANPIGKMLRMRDDDFNDELCKVTGVVIDPPQNTHLKFDVLISYKTLFARGDWAPGRYDQSWGRKDMYTYIKVLPGSDPEALTGKFPGIIEKYSPDLKENNRRDEFILQSLGDIHLYSQLTDEAEINGDGEAVNFLLIIACFIVIIAWVNYINLSTSRALERAKEVGLRKVVGAFRGQLIKQFLAESFLVNLFGIALAIVIVILSLRFFNDISGMSLTIWSLNPAAFWITLTLLALVGAFCAGAYPAFVLSSFQPVKVLRGKFTRSASGSLLRSILVTLQFGMSIALIAGTFIVYKQLNYMQGRNLGFNPEQTLVVERPGVANRDREERRRSIDAFKTDAANHHAIRAVTGSSTVPGKKMRFKTEVYRQGENSEEGILFTFSGVDFDFMPAFEMEIIAGRVFSRDYPSDADTAAVITESAARVLGFQKPADAIGQILVIERFRWNPIVVGVIKDYHQESLKLKTHPTLFYMTQYGAEYYMMKVNTGDVSAALSHIEGAWQRNFPGNPFQYFFLDDYFNRQYQSEQQFGKLFAVFAILALVIGCLGLFGLSAFNAQQRTKEIGVRKVLGASVPGIVYLLSTDVIRLVLIAGLVATPIIFLIMNNWLEKFAYRTEVGWLIYIAAAGLVLLVALLTVAYQTIRAATRNPVESLQYE